MPSINVEEMGNNEKMDLNDLKEDVEEWQLCLFHVVI